MKSDILDEFSEAFKEIRKYGLAIIALFLFRERENYTSFL